MKTFNSIFFLCVFLFSISGCASSKLKLELSIYKEDPNYSNLLTQASLKPVKAYLDDMSISVGKVNLVQQALADGLYATYSYYWDETQKAKGRQYTPAKVYTPEMLANDLQVLTQSLAAHKSQLNGRSADVKAFVGLANAAYQRLYNNLPATAEEFDFNAAGYSATQAKNRKLQQELRIALSDVEQSFEKLVYIEGMPFETMLKDRWQLVLARLADPVVQEQLAAIYPALNQQVRQQAQAILDTDSAILEVKESLKIRLVDAINSGDMDDVRQLIAVNPMVYTISAEEESKRLQAFDLLNSQLERLQNPGDPVWRVVTAEENEEKWNEQFSKTYFFAEGNSGVVIVRDSPIDYRVQEGANNPAALVQAQLGVSRSIADAAIQIAGATAGVPLSTTSLSNGSVNKTDNADYQAETESLVMKKATLERKIQLRALAIDSLQANIKSKLEQIKALHPVNDKDKIDQLASQLVISLKARKAYFADKLGGN